MKVASKCAPSPSYGVLVPSIFIGTKTLNYNIRSRVPAHCYTESNNFYLMASLRYGVWTLGWDTANHLLFNKLDLRRFLLVTFSSFEDS